VGYVFRDKGLARLNDLSRDALADLKAALLDDYLLGQVLVDAQD
jgi:hypothetical protein